MGRVFAKKWASDLPTLQSGDDVRMLDAFPDLSGASSNFWDSLAAVAGRTVLVAAPEAGWSLQGQFTEREREWIEAQPKRDLHALSTALAKVLAAEVLIGSGRERLERFHIEIIRDEAGSPFVVLASEAAALARERGIVEVGVSLSEDAGVVAGVAIALRGATGSRAPRGQQAVSLTVGVDIVSLARAADLLEYPVGALSRIFSAREMDIARSGGSSLISKRLASMFAVKEASFKALGGCLHKATTMCRDASNVMSPPVDVRDVVVTALDGSIADAEFGGATAQAARQGGFLGLRVGVTAAPDNVAAVAILASQDICRRSRCADPVQYLDKGRLA
jgi:phosphopantetheine--protein transferase-like protein